MYNWKPLADRALKAQNILIFTHINMDGDAVGSSTALCLALRKMGKNCFILCEDKLSEYLSFLDKGCFVYEEPFETDLAIAVDIGDDSRLEKRLDAFYRAKERICIDHHVPKDEFADDRVVDHRAAAAGLLVFDFLKFLKVEIDSDMADLLYSAIVTDTGSFKYDATDGNCLRCAAELIDLGADNVLLSNKLFDNHRLIEYKVENQVFNNAQFICGGKVVISYITEDQLASIGAKSEDCETSVDMLRGIKGVEIAAILKQRGENVFKLSMRSKYYADVRAIVSSFGGGGHVKAAGATLNMSLDEALNTVISAVEAGFRGEE